MGWMSVSGMISQGDAELLAEYARSADAAAFEAFARRHADWIYSAALRMTGEATMAEDVTQGVMLAASRKASGLSRHPAIVSWLFRATRFGAGAVLRAERRRRRHEAEAARMSAGTGDKGDAAQWAEVREVLDGAVTALPAREREAILLRFYRQLSHAEIAAALSLTEEAVRKRVSRAVSRLRAKIGMPGSDTSLSSMLGASAVTGAPRGLSLSRVATPGARVAARAARGASTLARLKVATAVLVVLGTAAAAAMWGRGRPATPEAARAVSASPPATRVAGRDVAIRVVDAEGRGVAQATVGAQVWGLATGVPAVIVDTTTNASGEAALRIPDGGQVKFVYASKGGVGLDYYAVWPAEHLQRDPYHLEQSFAGPLKFTLNGAKTIRVHARDEAGKPLAGVEVYPWGMGKPGKGEDLNVFQFRQRTGADGNAGITEIPADTTSKRITVWAKLEGYASPSRWNWDASRPDDVLNVTLVRQVHVRGTVTDGGAEPIGAATVTLAGAGRGAMTSFSQVSVPVGPDGTFEADVDPDMAYVFVATKGRYVSRQVSRVILRSPPAEPIKLELAEGVHVTGRVTEGDQGRPVSDLIVALHLSGKLSDLEHLPNPDDSRRAVAVDIAQRVKTDAEGQFDFYACPGDYGIDVSVPGERVAQRLSLAQGEKEKRVDLRVRQVAAIPSFFRGRVVREEGGAEVPVPGAKLTGMEVEVHGNLTSPSAIADAGGRFEMEDPPAGLFVYAESPEGALRSLTRVDAGARDVTIKLGPVATAHGRVVMPDGTPGANLRLAYGIRFTVSRAPQPVWMTRFGGTATTAADGSFDLPNLVPGSKYDLTVDIGEGGDWRRATLKDDVVAGKPGIVDLGDLTYTPSTRAPRRR